MATQLSWIAELKHDDKHERAIIAKLANYGLTIMSPWNDIVKALSGTVMPKRNTLIAERMRNGS